jgi:uncharacterized protein (TIGR02452 family)
MLQPLPYQDSDEMAEACKAELIIPRDKAAALGWTAVEAADRGYYEDSAGGRVDWADLVERAVAEKTSIAPDDPLPARDIEFFDETRVHVANETTLRAARRMVDAGLRPLALNFANGIQPGGGFLGGARAQEEVLCRSSALYKTLNGDPMYRHHGGRSLPDSTEWAILSPDVPVFRTDAGETLDEPWLLSFITCAAPVARSVGQPAAGDLLERRIRRVLAIASAHGYESLVLGAWGCGAFGNDPVRTARDFRHALESDFSGHFSDIVFAVTDWSPERKTLGPFRDTFAA